MDSISDRERILLGYAPRDALGGIESRSQRWNTDIDFVDVFGGPPRRASINKSRRIRRDSIDTSSRLSSGRGDLEASHRSRLGSDEKPVFGDVYDSSRRQQLGDDFYRDIFQISESVCASPMNGDPGPLMSSPSSRISSPNGPAPSRWDSPFGGSVLQTHPRLSETIDKVSDYPAFDFPTKHSTFKSGEGENDAFSYPSSSNGSSTGLFTGQSIAGHVDLRNSGYNSYCQNPLSHKIPLVFEGFSEAMGPTFGIGEMLAGDNSNILENYINNKQFHFSIYEWAGKGVMLVMPSDFDEKKDFKGHTRLPEVIVQELELHTDRNYFSRVTKPLKSGTVLQDTKAEKKADYHAENIANVSLTDSDLMFFEVATNIKSDKYGNQSEKASGSDFEENYSTCNTYEKQNSESKSPRLFDSDMDKHRNHDIPVLANGLEAELKSSKWKQLRKESKLIPGEVNCNTLHDILSLSEDKARGNMVKGKVKEFIKKFTQESPQKRRSAFDVRKRSKGEDSRHDKVDELTHLSVTELDKLQEGVVNKIIPLFDVPCVRENHVIKSTEEEISNIFYNDPTIDDSPSEEKIEVLHPQSGPASEDLINSACNEEIIPEDIEYMVHQLPVKQTEEAQNISQLNQIKNLEANILQWSKGKEGNIRSLLSTLQLVLWPECGWKQVPLVTIIEGPSVKKAYQKALLCLHPDKLQQKGASSDQKYIAEKVFDILQEAWDNFNLVSQF